MANSRSGSAETGNGSVLSDDNDLVPPFFNTTYSTHRVSPLYIGGHTLDQDRLDVLAHRLRDTLAGDVVRGIQISLESVETGTGQVGALQYVRITWFDVSKILDGPKASEVRAFDGETHGLWIQIRHENAQYIAMLIPGYSERADVVDRPDPTWTMQGVEAPPDVAREGERFAHLPLLLLRMPMALKGVIGDWLSSTFDCRVSKLSLGTKTLVSAWQGWIDTYGISSKGTDFVMTLAFNAPLPGTSDAKEPDSDSDSDSDLSSDEQMLEPGLRSMSVAIAPQDLVRFLRAGEILGADKYTSSALWETNERERHRLAGGNVDDGWAWRANDTGDHPFTEAVGRYVRHHLGLNMFHPSVRVIQVSCGGFSLSQSRIKIIRKKEDAGVSIAAWKFVTQLGDRIRGEALPAAISSATT